MIFVTIGTMYGFPRLIEKMDYISKIIDEDIIMQIGETNYEPKKAKYFRFATREEMDKIYEESRIVVSHAGIGSIISAMQYNKPIIVFPRKKEYAEALDDHQLEISKELEKEGVLKVAQDTDQLRDLVLNYQFDKHKNHNTNQVLVQRLKEYIERNFIF